MIKFFAILYIKLKYMKTLMCMKKKYHKKCRKGHYEPLSNSFMSAIIAKRQQVMRFFGARPEAHQSLSWLISYLEFPCMDV